MFWFHPAAVLILGAALLPFVKEKSRRPFMLAVPLVALLAVILLPNGLHGKITFLSWELTTGRMDALSRLFGLIMTLMCFLSTLFALHVKNPLEHIAAWCYAAGSLGVVLAGDYVVLFVFWELMAFASVCLVWARHTPQALSAGYRYLLLHGFGGILLLTGIVLYQRAAGGDFSFVPLDVNALGAGGWFILAGFLLNAAAPPLHTWLPDAYGEATPSGSVFLSAFTTKTAVYALARGFAGMPLLLPLGVFMVVFGVVYAMLQNDFRRLLGYHIISQVGYMVAGIGIGTGLAISGACAHAIVHILYKGLLFMGTGSVLTMTGKSRFTDLGGLFQKMPVTLACTAVGGLSISSCVGFSGFVTKSMIVTSALESHYLLAALLMMIAASGTFLSTTLKMIHHVWFGENRCDAQTWEKAADPPWNMRAAMIITAALCVILGTFGYPLLYWLLPYPVHFNPYTSGQIFETVELLFGTAVMFFLLLPRLKPESHFGLDVDWFYRRGGQRLMGFLKRLFAGENRLLSVAAWEALTQPAGNFFRRVLLRGSFLTSGFMPALSSSGKDQREWLRDSVFPIGLCVFMAVSALALFTVFFLCEVGG